MSDGSAPSLQISVDDTLFSRQALFYLVSLLIVAASAVLEVTYFLWVTGFGAQMWLKNLMSLGGLYE